MVYFPLLSLLFPSKQNKYCHIASDIHGKTTFAYTNLFCVKIYHGGCDNHRRPRNAIIINFRADTGDTRENKVCFLAATLLKVGRGGKLFSLSLQTGKIMDGCCVYFQIVLRKKFTHKFVIIFAVVVIF